MRVANRDARAYVQDREIFTGSNIFAVDTCTPAGSDLYIVYSYGEHFPMYIAEEFNGEVNWYENQDGYSRSTQRQQSQCHPHEDTTLFTTEQMRVLAKRGITGLAVCPS